jgi:hypothetical protein
MEIEAYARCAQAVYRQIYRAGGDVADDLRIYLPLSALE